MSATRATRLSQVEDSVRRLQAEADRVVGRVRTKISDFAKSPAKEIGELVGEARKVRGTVRNQVRTAVERVEARAEPLFSRVERSVLEALRPVAQYLDIASRREMEDLQRRLNVLEKRIDDLRKSAEAA